MKQEYDCADELGDYNEDEHDLQITKEIEKPLSSLPRGGSKQLTMKYNMQTLRKIQGVDDRTRAALGLVYECDPDDVEVDYDLVVVYHAKPEERKQMLIDMFKEVPIDTTSLVDDIIRDLNALT